MPMFFSFQPHRTARSWPWRQRSNVQALPRQRFSLRPSVSVWGVVGLLCLTGGWLGREVITPPAAQAYDSRLDVILDVLQGETYDAFLRRAESVARAAAQRSFDRDILVTEVAIFVSGQRDGVITPVLLLNASRVQWRAQPDTRRWATYFSSARAFLGLDRAPAAIAEPTTPVVTTTGNPAEVLPPKPKPTVKTATPQQRQTTRRPQRSR